MRDDLPEAPDEPASAAEEAMAAAFARRLDQLLAGDELPPAMPADERAVIEVAGMVRACVAEIKLEPGRRDRLVDQALTQALTQARAAGGDGAARAGGARDGADEGGRRDELGAYRRKRLARLAPWAIAAAAAAAALILALDRPARPGRPARAGIDVAAPAVPGALHSRPADALIGPIPRDRADAASERLDVIYADRMAAYRDLRFQGGAR